MRLTFRRVAGIVMGLYILVTCYTGYMVIRRKLEKPDNGEDHTERKVKVPPDDPDWNPWGQEFEKENQKPPEFEQPHLILRTNQDLAVTQVHHGNIVPVEKHHGIEVVKGTKVIDTAGESEQHVVEIWGKAAIGLYLWEHIMEGTLEQRLGGIWSYGTQVAGNIQFRFRTGPGVVQTKVPQDVRHLVLVINGREPAKIQFARDWLDYLPQLEQLQNVAVVLLGNEQCNNQWLRPYLRQYGGPVKVVFLVYDSPEVDDENFFQWPLGVATYRGFPLFHQAEVSSVVKRPYVCNFLGTVYPNSSRASLLSTLQNSPHASRCIIKGRTEWLAKESDSTRQAYIQALTDSDLTLNPVGMNTECYRLYEALSLGSTPVVEDVMTSPGNCGGPNHTPLRLLKKYNAPFIWVKNWTEIGDVLKKESERTPEEVVKRRQNVLQWYTDFRAKMKELFVSVIRRKFFTMDR